jgi:hypothetical protein
MPLHVSISSEDNADIICLKQGESLNLQIQISNRTKHVPNNENQGLEMQTRRRKWQETRNVKEEEVTEENGLLSIVSKSFGWLGVSDGSRPHSVASLNGKDPPTPSVSRPPSSASRDSFAPRSTVFAEPFGCLNLAYCMVQVLGTLQFDPTYIVGDALDELRKRSMYFPGASGGGGGQLDLKRDVPVLSAPPTLLFSDILLDPDASRAFSYSINLGKIPESFRGRLCRISYRILVTVGLVDQKLPPIHIVNHQVPFRVLAGNYSEQPIYYDVLDPVVLFEDGGKVSSLDSTRRELTRADSLNMDVRTKVKTLLENVKHVDVQTEQGTHKSKRMYTIRKNSVLVAQLTLSTTFCIPGQTIVAELVFPDEETQEPWSPCLDYSVMLESWEEVCDAFVVGGKKELAGKISSKVWGEWKGEAGRDFKVERTRFGIDLPLNMMSVGRISSNMGTFLFVGLFV